MYLIQCLLIVCYTGKVAYHIAKMSAATHCNHKIDECTRTSNPNTVLYKHNENHLQSMEQLKKNGSKELRNKGGRIVAKKLMTKRYTIHETAECKTKRKGQANDTDYSASLLIRPFLSLEFRGDSSSENLSPSSPTANIVSPSRDGRCRREGSACFGGAAGDWALGSSSGILLSELCGVASSSMELAKERISKSSSSCANC